jgi:peptidoglycan hydrolase CwlO-like protein
LFNNFEKIKETYKVTSILDTINNIDIIAVAKHDLEWLIDEVEKLQDWVEVQEEAMKHLRFQLENANNQFKELEDKIAEQEEYEYWEWRNRQE